MPKKVSLEDRSPRIRFRLKEPAEIEILKNPGRKIEFESHEKFQYYSKNFAKTADERISFVCNLLMWELVLFHFKICIQKVSWVNVGRSTVTGHDKCWKID